MKLTRNPVGAWFSNMPRDRRASWIFLTVLVAMLGAIVVYQRMELGTTTPPTAQNQVFSPGSGQSGALVASEEPGRPVQAASGVVAGPPSHADVHQPWVRPLTGTPRVIKAFGSIDERPGSMQYFQAVAFAAEVGQPVIAANQGVVLEAGQNSLEGGVVRIRHNNGLESWYAGLGTVSVAQGAIVQSGQSIGEIGAPGLSNHDLGPHLEFKVLGKDGPVDPMAYLPK